MNLVTIKAVSKQFSERLLFDQIDFLINAGDRIGLIGANGSGKTTLLNIIAGEESPDKGQVMIWGGVSMQYLSQTPQLDENMTILDYVFQSDAPEIQLLHDFEQTSVALQKQPDDEQLQAKLSDLSQEMDRTGSWAAGATAKTILSKLGFTDFGLKIGILSGGQRRRVAMAHALLTPADLLILDEPTNHIDADTISWLEEYLMKRAGALLMVTHDRYFLDRVANRIVELDRRQLVSYPGNYTEYLALRTERQERLEAAEVKRQNMLRRELAWLRRGAQARSTKQKARIQRVEALKEIEYDRGDQRVTFALASRRLGKQVLEAKDLSKQFDGPSLFNNIDFTLNPGDRIGIVGPNGAGKSTFLNILAQKLTPDNGTIQWGETVHLGYYDQESAGLKDELRVRDFIDQETPLIHTDEGERVTSTQMLEWFLFTRPEQQTYIGSLSGGERRRLYLLHVLAQQPNVLFLDEPTNDLDIRTLSVLEQFLDHFKGCLIVVSHDRYFLDRNVDYLMSFEDGVLGTRYPTPYETYQQMRAEAPEQPAIQSKPISAKPVSANERNRPRKLSWKEQREFEGLEARIEALETEKVTLETEINASGNNFERMGALAQQLEAVETELATAEERWLELSEIVEG